MKKSLLKSTGIVASATLLSRIMGYVRDMVIAYYFGASATLDGFFVAFRIPNLFRRLVAEGSLTVSFVPVYTEYLLQKGEEKALELAQKTFSILLIVLIITVILGEVFSREIVNLFGYGFTDKALIDLTVNLNNVMFPYIFFIGLVSFAMGYLNSRKIFFAPAFAPVLLNVGFIFGALFLRNTFSEPLYGLAAGVIIGGVMQMLFQIPYMIKAGFKAKISIDVKHPGMRSIFKMMTPALFGIAIYQINTLISTILASFLAEGSISYIYYSDRLNEIVLGIFIISIGNVILPELSGFSASNQTGKIRELYKTSVSAALFVALPAAIALMIAGLPVVSVLFMRGEFSPHDVQMTYRALFCASVGIPFISVIRITVPVFYSLKNTRVPIISALMSFILNIICGYFLMQTPLKHAGLTLANSIAAFFQMFILIFALRKIISIKINGALISSILKFVFACIAMSAILFYFTGRIDWLNTSLGERFYNLLLLVLSGITGYMLISYFLKVKEIKYLTDVLKQKFKKIE